MLSEVEVKSTISRAWQEAIGDTLAETRNFFVCGGNSLDAVRVSMKISRAIGFTVRPRLLFEHPVIEDYENAVVELLASAKVTDERVHSQA